MESPTIFERTWEAAIEICRRGCVSGQAFTAGTSPFPDDPEHRCFAVFDAEGRVVFSPRRQDMEDHGCLFVVARRFAELEDAHRRGTEPEPAVEEPRRTYVDSLREWGLMNEDGELQNVFDHDPEPLLGYVVRVGSVYAYGVVKRSILSAGTITPSGACETPEEARRRASELLMLALVRGATVMGMNGIPAVIDLSAENEEAQ